MTKSRSNRKGKQARSPYPSAISSVYRGPIQSRKYTAQEDLHTVVKGFTVTCASTAGGVIADVIADDVTQIGDWASLAAVYGMYRVLGMKVTFAPSNQYSKTTTSCVNGVTVVDKTGSGALASYVTGMNHASGKIFSLENKSTRELRMQGTTEGDWITVSAPVSKMWFKDYVSGLTISTTYGTYFVWLLVQFRGVE